MDDIHFFAPPTDIRPVLRRFEANAPLKFVQTRTMTTPNRAIYLRAAEIPNPGVTHGPETYMVSHRARKNATRMIIGDQGQQIWSLHNCDNEEAVLLDLAGLWKTGTLLPGNMNTMHETPAAQQLMQWFLSALKQEGFVKIRAWWVGREAMNMLKVGRRLTTGAEQSPAKYDLCLPRSDR